MARFVFICFFCCIPLWGFAVNKTLTPSQAIQLKCSVSAADRLSLKFSLAKQVYLYKKKKYVFS